MRPLPIKTGRHVAVFNAAVVDDLNRGDVWVDTTADDGTARPRLLRGLDAAAREQTDAQTGIDAEEYFHMAEPC